MIEKIFRNYIEIKSFKDFKEIKKPSNNYSVELVDQKDFQLNKFFYKNIGKSYQWIDRLVWTDQNWVDYVSNKKLSTYMLKDNQDLAGYFELIFYQDTNEAEIAYLGILEDYLGKKSSGGIIWEWFPSSWKSL